MVEQAKRTKDAPHGRIRQFLASLGEFFNIREDQTLSKDPIEEMEELAKKLGGSDSPLDKLVASSRMLIVSRQQRPLKPRPS